MISLRHWMLLAGVVAGAAAALPAQTVVRVRLVQSGPEAYRFDPARITMHPGEVLEFVVASGGPYVVGFEPQDLTGPARELLAAAIPDSSGPLRGPVLAAPGARFRLVLPRLPKGRYRFLCPTHLAYRMGGVLTVP